ncbi:MAG TPA: M20/M25/M40 family metallo-hydrolase [Symbiobacteriaceae bacterium]|nr:M20/M25/M40 family metallo-hydrolase [Symbiobacteriaceae bacterium]
MESIRRYRQEHAGEIVQELVSFVRVPNNVYVVEQIQRNAGALRAILERRGIRSELLPTVTGKPLVYGELLTPGAAAAMLIYGHYDGVPAEPARWHSDPYEPVLRTHLPVGPEADWSAFGLPANGWFDGDWRLFGRSVADSKNAIIAMMAALDALRAAGQRPGINLKFLFDGEEELESPCLPAVLETYRERLAADVMISASGERHQSGRPTVEFGIRGILMFDLTVYTGTVALHSGHFGNFAPSAAFQLAHLLASLKRQDGGVQIEGFYDEVTPLSESELNAIRQIPAVEEQVRRQFGLARAEVEGRSLQELINLPTLNVRGVRSGFVGDEARNIIPNTATADFDVRLVRSMDPDRTLATIAAHIERQGWTVLDREPSRAELLAHGRVVRLRKRSGFPATRTPLDSPVAGQVVKALQRAADEPLVVMPTEGGSLPMCLFEQIGLPFVGLPTSNFDCNQHTDDENLQLEYLFEAVDLFASLFRWE